MHPARLDPLATTGTTKVNTLSNSELSHPSFSRGAGPPLSTPATSNLPGLNCAEPVNSSGLVAHAVWRASEIAAAFSAMPVFNRPNSLAIVDKPLDLGGGQGERELMLVLDDNACGRNRRPLAKLARLPL